MGSSSLFMFGNTDEASRPNTASTSYTSSGLLWGEQQQQQQQKELVSGLPAACAAANNSWMATHCSNRTIWTGRLSPMGEI